MNESTGGVLALAVGGAALGAAAGALVVSLLSGPGVAPPPVATPPPEVKKVTITLKKEAGVCKASLGEGEKHVLVEDYEPGVRFEIYNDDCGDKQVFRLREKRGTLGRRPVPVRCRFLALVPDDVAVGTSVDLFPECVFPLEKRYKGVYEYILQLCKEDESGCKTYDPEIDVKRR